MSFQPANQPHIYLRIVAWTGSEEVPQKESTHTQSKGLHACLTGRFLWSGTVQANLHTLQLPWAEPLKLRAGSKGILRFYVFDPARGPNAHFQMGARIVSVNHASAVAGLVTWSLSMVSDSSVATFTYPS